MKQINSHAAIIALFLLLMISNTSARRLLSSHRGDSTAIKPDEITQQENGFSSLMGLEACGDDKDEECEKRRMVAEAHLDYIYTQHHHP